MGFVNLHQPTKWLQLEPIGRLIRLLSLSGAAAMRQADMAAGPGHINTGLLSITGNLTPTTPPASWLF